MNARWRSTAAHLLRLRQTDESGAGRNSIELVREKMRKQKSSVLRARRLSGKVLSFMLDAEADTLAEFADDSKTGRAGKTLVKEGSLRITLVALKKGTVLPSHQVAGPVSIQTIRGCLRLTTDTGDMDLPARMLIALGPRVAHTAKAHTDCAILLTFAMSPS